MSGDLENGMLAVCEGFDLSVFYDEILKRMRGENVRPYTSSMVNRSVSLSTSCAFEIQASDWWKIAIPMVTKLSKINHEFYFTTFTNELETLDEETAQETTINIIYMYYNQIMEKTNIFKISSGW